MVNNRDAIQQHEWRVHLERAVREVVQQDEERLLPVTLAERDRLDKLENRLAHGRETLVLVEQVGLVGSPPEMGQRPLRMAELTGIESPCHLQTDMPPLQLITPGAVQLDPWHLRLGMKGKGRLDIHPIGRSRARAQRQGIISGNGDLARAVDPLGQEEYRTMVGLLLSAKHPGLLTHEAQQGLYAGGCDRLTRPGIDQLALDDRSLIFGQESSVQGQVGPGGQARVPCRQIRSSGDGKRATSGDREAQRAQVGR